ncbi:MAG: hypothetical protein ABH879_05535 [archaeon]
MKKGKRFLVIVVEMYLVLKLYELVSATGLSMNVYLLILLLLIVLANYIGNKIELSGSIPRTIMFKVIPRLRFSSEAFSFAVGGAITAGFFFSRQLQSAFLTYLIIFALTVADGFLLYPRTQSPGDVRKKSYGMVLLALIFGIFMGNRYSSSPIVVVIFLFANLCMYLASEPTERRAHIMHQK